MANRFENKQPDFMLQNFFRVFLESPSYELDINSCDLQRIVGKEVSEVIEYGSICNCLHIDN